MIKILKKKTKRRRIKTRIPIWIWYLGLVWESEIYSRMAGNYGWTYMEILTGYTIDISDWTEFEFYNLWCYWDNHTDEAQGNIGRWVGFSHRVVSDLCYWVLTEKGKIIARTNVQHVTRDAAENPEIQHSIRNYHMTMESAIGADEVMSYLNGMDAFINE